VLKCPRAANKGGTGALAKYFFKPFSDRGTGKNHGPRETIQRRQELAHVLGCHEFARIPAIADVECGHRAQGTGWI
jgi:hypothetical protein